MAADHVFPDLTLNPQPQALPISPGCADADASPCQPATPAKQQRSNCCHSKRRKCNASCKHQLRSRSCSIQGYQAACKAACMHTDGMRYQKRGQFEQSEGKVWVTQVWPLSSPNTHLPYLLRGLLQPTGHSVRPEAPLPSSPPPCQQALLLLPPSHHRPQSGPPPLCHQSTLTGRRWGESLRRRQTAEMQPVHRRREGEGWQCKGRRILADSMQAACPCIEKSITSGRLDSHCSRIAVNKFPAILHFQCDSTNCDHLQPPSVFAIMPCL